jgi:hypothetical protein
VILLERQDRDTITVRDEHGNRKDYNVEALFDMDENSYALLSADNETILMRVEDNGDSQELVGIIDPVEVDTIMDAYEIAVKTDVETGENS